MMMATGMLAVAGCLGSPPLPRMISRPVAVQVGGLDCVSATLVEFGYTITDGDRPTGFVRGERQRLRRGGGLLFLNRYRHTDVLMVSATTSQGRAPRLNVTASRLRAPVRSVELDPDGHAVRVRQRGGEVGPSNEALADAEQLLERCAGASDRSTSSVKKPLGAWTTLACPSCLRGPEGLSDPYPESGEDLNGVPTALNEPVIPGLQADDRR